MIKTARGWLQRRLSQSHIPELGPTGRSGAPAAVEGNGPRLLTGEAGAEIVLKRDLVPHLAIFSDGNVLVSQRRQADASIQHAIQAARTLISGSPLTIKSASPKEILTAYGNVKSGRNEVTAALATFLDMIETAASLRVNEIIVILDGDYAVVVHMRNSRKEVVPAAGMHRAETMALIHAAFNNSNQGDQHPQFHVAKDATITNRDLLPDSVFGLRLHWEPEANGIVMNIRLAYWDTGQGLRGIAALHQPAPIADALQVGVQSSGGIIVIAGQPEMGKTNTQTRLLEDKAFYIEADGQYPIIWCYEEPIEALNRPLLYGDLGRFEEEGDALVDAVQSRVARLACNAIKLQECRDPVQAKILFGIANMGVFGCSTVHTAEVVDIPTRFTDLRVDPSVAFNAKRYILLVAQRLVPELCEHCARPVAEVAEETPHLAAIIAGYAKARIDIQGAKFAGPGCKHCMSAFSAKGVVGRKLLMEVYRPTQEFLDCLRRGDIRQARQHFLRDTEGHSLRLVALNEVRKGKLSLRDLQEIADPVQIREDLDLMNALWARREVA